jgi:hypothetical protein
MLADGFSGTADFATGSGIFSFEFVTASVGFATSTGLVTSVVFGASAG